jgi:hypothetical protein
MGKVALLVEDIVEGQEALVLFEEQTTAIEENGGINGRLTRLRLGWQRHARQHGCRQIARGGGQFIDGCAAARQEAGLFQKVRRRITADGQLRKDRQPGALSGGAAAGSNNFSRFPVKSPTVGLIWARAIFTLPVYPSNRWANAAVMFLPLRQTLCKAHLTRFIAHLA